MRIVVPVDFSENADTAVAYARDLAAHVGGTIHLLHVFHLPGVPMAVLNMSKVEEAINKEDKLRMEELAASIRSDKVSVSSHIMRDSSVAEGVQWYSEKKKAHLVIMGSRGAKGLKKILFGSNTTAVINKLSIPVLAVPEKGVFSGLQKITYATDLISLEPELKKVLAFAKPFGSTIQIVHVSTSDNSIADEQQELLVKLRKKYEYDQIHFNLIPDTDIVIALEEYIKKEKPDLFTMFTHKQGFTDRFFETSVTRELAFYNEVALLAFNNRQ